MTEFTKQIEIDNYIKEMGLFLSENNLFMKVGVFDWININDRKDKIVSHIENNTNPFSDLSITFPTISLSVFANYESREQSIAKNLFLLDEIENSQKKFLKKDWRLIELESFYRNDGEIITYLIFDIKQKEYNPIKKELLTDKERKSAFKIKNMTVINKLSNDNLKNRYEKAYEIELKRFDEIGIYDIGGLND